MFYLQIQRCSGCGKQGHNRRKCPNLVSLTPEAKLLTELQQRIQTALLLPTAEQRRALHLISQRTIDYY